MIFPIDLLFVVEFQLFFQHSEWVYLCSHSIGLIECPHSLFVQGASSWNCKCTDHLNWKSECLSSDWVRSAHPNCSTIRIRNIVQEWTPSCTFANLWTEGMVSLSHFWNAFMCLFCSSKWTALPSNGTRSKNID